MDGRAPERSHHRSPLLTWARAPRVVPGPAALAEAAALVVFLVASAAIVFLQPPEAAAQSLFRRPYILFLPLIWAALRFGVRGAATGTFLVAAAAVWGTYTGRGEFVRADWTESLFALHGFLVTASLASLAVGAVVSSHERSRQALSASESLFRAIAESTTDGIYVRIGAAASCS